MCVCVCVNVCLCVYRTYIPRHMRLRTYVHTCVCMCIPANIIMLSRQKNSMHIVACGYTFYFSFIFLDLRNFGSTGTLSMHTNMHVCVCASMYIRACTYACVRLCDYLCVCMCSKCIYTPTITCVCIHARLPLIM